jgi:signal transduction histidine kinase
MSEADQARYLKTDFLARVAHELRGPSGVALGALAELERAAGDPERTAALLQMVRRGVQRTLRTAERLERTADLEAERVKWEHEPCDFREIVLMAVAETEALERRKGVLVEVSADAPGTMLGDCAWLRIAVAELVSNAIRHARRAVTVTLRRGEDELVLTVRDDGPGFAAPIEWRFNSSQRRQGLALSLSLVRDVARAHRGQFSIEPGKDGTSPGGASVELRLPIAG